MVIRSFDCHELQRLAEDSLAHEGRGSLGDHPSIILVTLLTQHPHVGGRRSRIVQLDRLITYIKSKREVWFATMEQVAHYVKPTGS